MSLDCQLTVVLEAAVQLPNLAEMPRQEATAVHWAAADACIRIPQIPVGVLIGPTADGPRRQGTREEGPRSNNDVVRIIHIDPFVSPPQAE